MIMKQPGGTDTPTYGERTAEHQLSSSLKVISDLWEESHWEQNYHKKGNIKYQFDGKPLTKLYESPADNDFKVIEVVWKECTILATSTLVAPVIDMMEGDESVKQVEALTPDVTATPMPTSTAVESDNILCDPESKNLVKNYDDTAHMRRTEQSCANNTNPTSSLT